MVDLADTDYLSLTAQEFAQLEEYELQAALQQITGWLAVEQAKMRAYSVEHHNWLAAKEEFTNLKSMASTLQTLLRSMV